MEGKLELYEVILGHLPKSHYGGHYVEQLKVFFFFSISVCEGMLVYIIRLATLKSNI